MQNNSMTKTERDNLNFEYETRGNKPGDWLTPPMVISIFWAMMFVVVGAALR